MASTVVSLKRALRKELKSKLAAVPTSTITSECKYLPTGEINTREIIHHILHNDKTCYVPRWTKDAMEMVKIKSWDEYLALPVNKWNIPEPSHEQVMENALEKDGLDLIIVPAMAFGEDHSRIGHGKG
ncbi:5-formyltetrahydrofolate cyclo-ligase [Fennellomyces sp. T-0311]|nr:5-formyltetrahydrofolate cyclo-ligase [Fennellomyces sp. T-0311]